MILIEVIHYLALLGSFIPLAYSFSNPHDTAAIFRFHDDFWKVSNQTFAVKSDFWSWCDTTLIPKLYDTGSAAGPVADVTGESTFSYDSSAFSLSSSLDILARTDMVLMGPIRLRQVRVNEGQCSDDSAYRSIASFCSPSYDPTSNNNWETFISTYAPAYLREGFTYKDVDGSSVELTSDSTLIRYPSSGFIVDLPRVRGQAVETIQDLSSYDWIDFLTAAVIVEVTTYHASLNMFAVDRILFEFPPDGVMHVSHRTDSFQSFEVSFVGAYASQMALNVVNILWPIVGLVCMGIGIFTLGRRFVTFFWNWYDVAMIVIAFTYIGHRISLMKLSPSDSFGFPTIHLGLASLVGVKETAIELQGLILCLVFLRAFKFTLLADLRLVRAANNSLGLAIGLACAAGFVLIGFSFAFHLGIGYTDRMYAFVRSAFTARALSLLHVVWVSGTRGMGAFLNLWFIWSFYLIIVPVLVAVGIHAWSSSYVEKLENRKPHPLAVLLVIIWNRVTRKTMVEPVEARQVQVSAFPKMIAERIFARRKKVRIRVAAKFGFFPAVYNEQSETIDLIELQRLLDEDPFIVKVFGSQNAEHVADRLVQGNSVEELQMKVNRKIDMLQKTQLNLQFKVDPRIETVSSEIHDSLRRVQIDAESDIKSIIGLINDLKKSLDGISSNVRRRSVQLS